MYLEPILRDIVSHDTSYRLKWHTLMTDLKYRPYDLVSLLALM